MGFSLLHFDEGANKINMSYQSIKQIPSYQFILFLHEMIPGLWNLLDRAKIKILEEKVQSWDL